MEPIIFFKGFIIGLMLCAPMGPIGVLCVRRALTQGRIAGVLSVLGASTADGLYCTIAGFGMTYISDFLRQEKETLQILGGLILVLVGIRIFFARPPEDTPRPNAKGLVDAFFSTFLLMLANPMPILVFTAAFAALGVYGWNVDYASAAILVLGVFLGSALWAPALAAGLGLFRTGFNSNQIQILNRISGAIIVAFGLGLILLTIIR